MIVLHVLYQLPESSRDRFLKKLEELALGEKSRQEQGNIDYSYYCSVHSLDQVLLIEVWESQAALEAHQRTPHYQEWMKIKGEYVQETKLQKFVVNKEKEK